MENSSLFARFISENNFRLAWQRVKEKGSAGGIDQVSVSEFSRNSDRRLEKLRRDLGDGNYIPQPVRSLSIPKFNDKNEWRELGLPTVADKIVQAAFVQAVEPVLENIFSPASFAYRPGKGYHRAIEQVNALLAAHRSPWIVRQDIDNFFDSLDHRLLLELFAKYVNRDSRLLELVALWCRNGVAKGDGSWRDSWAGVRQGHVVAPLLANLYLHELDMYAAGLPCGWIRYADDFVAICTSESMAIEVNGKIENFLQDQLGLRLNENRQPVAGLAAGFSFLGIFFQTDCRRIADKKFRKMKKKIAWITNTGNRESAETVFSRLAELAKGWKRSYGFIDPREQFAELDREIRDKLLSLINHKVEKQFWPDEPPQELCPPYITPPEGGKKTNTWQKTLWRQALARSTEQVLQRTGKKTEQSRRRYHATSMAGEILVTSPGHFIGKSGKRLVVRQGRKIIAEMPVRHVRHLLLGSRGQSLSTDVIHFCLEHGISIHFLDERGTIYATMHQPGSQRAEIGVLQVKRRDEPAGMDIARAIIRAKMKNQFGVLKYFAKYNGGNRKAFCAALDENKAFLTGMIKKTMLCGRQKTPDDQRQHLMGLEGVFAGRYWQLFAMLLPEGTVFPGRKKRGASDKINSMLNYGYGILYAKILQAITLAGLNPEIGFLHGIQNGRPALSLDMIEMFRAPVVDRTVVSMLNRKIAVGLTTKGLLTDDSRKKLARNILQNLNREITWKGKKCALFAVIKAQAKELCSHLEGKKRFSPYLYKW